MYSVRVHQRSLGVGFISIDSEIVISEVVYKSLAYQKGLGMGDTLLSINGIAVKDMDTYYCHPLPFKATFRTNPSRDIDSNHHSGDSTATLTALTLSNSVSDSVSSSKSMSFSVDEDTANLQPLEETAAVSQRSTTFNARSLRIPQFLFSERTELKESDRGLRFDRHHIYNEGHALCIVSSEGLSAGKHQWSLQIVRCDIYRQEIGVIGAVDDDFKCNANGLLFSSNLGARAVYGYDGAHSNMYYASYNDSLRRRSSGRTQRIYRDLSKTEAAWKPGDVIKIELDLNRWNIRFSVNGKSVSNNIGIEPLKTYHPAVSFMGHCRYKLLR